MATPTSTSRVGERSSSASSSKSPGSPARMSRLQEKEELQHLNDRLAVYIERARALEADDKLLRAELGERQETAAREQGTLRLLYETELADARKLLDTIANERARLQVELGQSCEEHRQLQARNSKKEADLNLALSRLRELEAQLNTKDAELATVLGGKRNLEELLQDLKAQVVSLECRLRDSSKHLHDEMLRRVDLENKILTLREQLEFHKTVHEQEITETKRRHETKLVEIDSGRRTEFENQLAEALQELRKDNDEQIQEYKDELERTFNAKIQNRNVTVMGSELIAQQFQEHREEMVDRLVACEVPEQIECIQEQIEGKKKESLEQLENAQLLAARNGDHASAAMEEVTAIQLRVESLTAELTHYQRQSSALENQVKELKEALEVERDLSRGRLNDKDQEVSEMRQKLQSHLEEHEQLLDVKLALDMEIHAYRKMLEGEEHRLNVSSSPSGRSAVSQATTSKGGHLLRGKKRKLDESERGDVWSRLKIVQRISSSGHVSIDEVDPDGKFIRIKNSFNEDQPLHGWTLRRQLGSMSEIIYKFPNRFLLKAGQTVTIWGAGAGVSQSPPSDLVWKTQRSWGIGENVGVTLIDPNGKEVAERTISRVSQEDEESGKFEEETICETDFRHPSHQTRKGSCTVM